LRLSPEVGEPSTGQKVRTAFSVSANAPRFQNPVFPVYAGPGPSFAGPPELSARRAPAVSDRTWPEWTQGSSLRPPAYPPPLLLPASTRLNPNSAVAMFEHSGSHRRRPRCGFLAPSDRGRKRPREVFSMPPRAPKFAPPPVRRSGAASRNGGGTASSISSMGPGGASLGGRRTGAIAEGGIKAAIAPVNGASDGPDA
jgi:hypothetical protein